MIALRWIAVWIGVFLPVTVFAEDPHVRPLDRPSARAFDNGMRVSGHFRGLVDRVEGSNLIVHVVTVPSLPAGTSGRTRFVSEQAGHRYVRIELLFALSGDQRVATLGHELQHACELAQSKARTGHEVRALFERIGRPVDGMPDAFDTNAALEAGWRVWQELRTEPRGTGPLRD